MTGRREILRKRAQMRRDIEKGVAKQEAVERCARVGAIVDDIRAIVAHEGFVSIAKSLGISSFPRRLANIKVQAECSEDIFDFIVAWKFLSPMIKQAEVSKLLNAQWPGFIEAFKDVFISLVTNGPFPEERKTPIRPTFFR